MSWITDLDACASAGILGFDAPAHIRGAQPRYVGNPPLEGVSENLPQIQQQPQKDEFKSQNDTLHNNPSWKKWLLGGLIAAGTIFGLSKLKGIRNLFTSISFSSIKTIPAKLWNGVKSGWNWITKPFRRTP